MDTSKKTVVVVGAGPAGLMAAETLGRLGHAVTVVTQMATPGAKFLLAGRGGLNLTHSEPIEHFLQRYGTGQAWLESCVRDFDPLALRAWAGALGQPTKVGSSGRVFPEAFRATELLRAWLVELGRIGVELKTKLDWIGFKSDSGSLGARFRDSQGVLCELDADVIVLALGGGSYARTGSSGEWLSAMQEAGIEVTELAQTNCGHLVNWTDTFRDKFAGVPLKNVGIIAADQRARGDAMITKMGIEGGPVYGVSEGIHAMADDAHLVIDLAPDLTRRTLEERFENAKPGLAMGKLLRRCAKLSPVAISLLRECTGNELPRESLALAKLVKGARLSLDGPAPMAKAISTRGGIIQSEVNNDWMLHKMPGVFVAGEMLDWTAPTGGYLLQACFATGRSAGLGANRWLSSSD